MADSFDALLIGPARWAPDGAAQTFATPYGAAELRLAHLGDHPIAWADAGDSPFAAIYAARQAGAARVVELAPARARNRLLDPGDMLLPDDLVDRTQLPRYTFFAGKGYGFLSQREPFCPTLRGALLGAALERSARIFARGVYLAAPAAGADAPFWEGDVQGTDVVPASFLARELELCYAPLCVVAQETDPPPPMLRAIVAAALAGLPAARGCVCATAMQQYRDRGDIGEDWRTWVAV